MSKQEDNIQDQKLRDLFSQKSGSDDTNMDDFEKEALEGFSMLENEQEAFELKQELDQKMFSEVLVNQKKEKSYGLWYAAAGLLLIVGLSVYFVQSYFLNKEEKLALESIPENSHTPNEPEKIEGVQGTKSETLPAPEDKAPAKTVLPSKQLEKQNLKTIALESQPGAKDKMTEPITDSRSQDMAPMEDQVNLAASSPVTEKGYNHVMQQDDSKKLDQNETELEMAEVSTKEARKEKSSRFKKNKALDSDMQAPAAPASAMGASGNKPEILCAYRDGEVALLRDVKKLLNDKNLVKKFDALLFISAKGKIERAEISKAYDLSADEQKEVTALLKKLGDFEISQNAGDTYLYPYKLVFRP